MNAHLGVLQVINSPQVQGPELLHLISPFEPSVRTALEEETDPKAHTIAKRKAGASNLVSETSPTPGWNQHRYQQYTLAQLASASVEEHDADLRSPCCSISHP